MLYDLELTKEELSHNIRALWAERSRLEAEVDKLKREKSEEMRCKNEAYAFILESGLFEQYKEYSRLKVCGDNPHQACREWLDFEAKRRAQNRNNS